MKKLLALLCTLALMLGVMSACKTSSESTIEKANRALEENPYVMTMTMEFESDNQEMNQIFSAMNMEIPITVDGDNLAMEISMNIMGYSADIKMTVVDKVVYYKTSMMGQTAKMKASLSEEEYVDFKSNNNAEMMIKPEDFESFSIEKKDGKTYITCTDISENGLKELNDILEDSIKSLGGEATVSGIDYQIVLKNDKYEEMNMSCEYTVSVNSVEYTVSFNLSSKFSYDNVPSINIPSDASTYTETDAEDLIG